MEPRQTNNLPWWGRIGDAIKNRLPGEKSEERRADGRDPRHRFPRPRFPRPPSFLRPRIQRAPIQQQHIQRAPILSLIPVEILSEIFLFVSQLPGDKRWNWRALMLVCRLWRAIVLSTPGLHSQLTIRRATQKEVVQTFIQGRKTHLGVIVDMDDEGDGTGFIPENFHACFMAAIQAAPRWTSLNLISPPPHGEYKDLQILQPLTHLQSINLACGFDEFFEPLITAISRNAAPKLTTMVFADPAAVLCFAQPACSHIYNSLTTLKIQLLKRMDSPVDILPHLQRLETFEARRLFLPFYSPDSLLPLIHTLRFLYLKSVSVQWMGGRGFTALERCRIIFPQHADTIDGFQPVIMPSCSFLLYNSNDLHPLAHFHLPSLDTLDVKNAQWNVWRGNPQLASLCPIFAATSQCLTLLRLDVQSSEPLLVYMLKLAPVLEELWLGLAHGNALSKTFFQAFITRELHGASELVGPPSHPIAPLCPLLKLLHLHYRRWMRCPDKKALVAALGDIVGSRQLETKSSFSLRLSFDEAPEETHWTIGRPVKKVQYTNGAGLVLGVSTQHSIIPMTRLLPQRGLVSLPLKNPDSLYWSAGDSTSLELTSVRDHMGLVVHDNGQPPQPSSLSYALPLFDSLRVLDIKSKDSLFLCGHTFHKLERCRLLKVGWPTHSPHKRMSTEIGMPVCTRVDIDDSWMLAAFKLPQIRELASDFSHPYCSVIWDKQIAVNANLSGLNLLHMKNWPSSGDLIPILRSVPLLETLIIATTWRSVDSLWAFLPLDANGTSRQPSGDGKAFAVLCPRLWHLQIECEILSGQPDQAPFAEDIITLRAECGSPLKVFTVSEFSRKPGRKFELIERDGSFKMEMSVLADEAEKFQLDI